MKNFFLFFALTLFVIVPQSVEAQKIKLDSGNLKALKGQKEFNIVYEYDDMQVGKFDSEEAYIEERVTKLNDKEAGSGDKWKEGWFADREGRYHPKFEELLNVNLDKASASANNAGAKYTIVLKTVFTEPGFNVGVARKNASINVVIHFVESGTDNIIGVMTMDKIPGRGGMGYDFDTGFRIQEAYAKCGKELGKYLSKKVL